MHLVFGLVEGASLEALGTPAPELSFPGACPGPSNALALALHDEHPVLAVQADEVGFSLFGLSVHIGDVVIDEPVFGESLELVPEQGLCATAIAVLTGTVGRDHVCHGVSIPRL
jgi:hypothetical protein